MPKSKPPRVHSFEKVIVTSGKYDQLNRATGEHFVKEITPEDIQKTVQTFEQMTSKGLRVPAPWKHDFGITAITKIEEGDKGLLEDSTKNAGFWSSLFHRVNAEGKTELVGKIEVPGDPNDPNTPAGKVGTQVKDTSIYMRKQLPLTDGSGEILENALMHIALVTHPIESGQGNFELLEPDDSYIAMSQLIIESEQSNDLPELINKLKSVCKLYVPTSTTIDNFVTNLLIAVGQYELVSDNDEDLNSSNPNSKINVEPIIMSHFDDDQINALVNSKAINPKTGKLFAKEDFAEKPNTQEALIMSAMQTTMQDDRRRSYRSRIDTLVETGRTTKSFADTSLYTQADGYQLQFENGRIATPAIETIIMSLESCPAAKPGKPLNDQIVMGDGIDDLSAEDTAFLDNIASDVASFV